MASNNIQALVGALNSLQQIRYTTAAGAVIYLYDISLTLDLEVEYIWSQFSFTLPTVLYIINRYICLAPFLVGTYKLAQLHDNFSDDFCKIPIEFIGFIVATVTWGSILTLRVRALWLQNRAVVWSIYILGLCLMGIFLAVTTVSNLATLGTMRYVSLMQACVPDTLLPTSRLAPLAPAIYELFLTMLTLIKAFDFARHPVSEPLPFLYRVVMQDGVAYFLVSTAVYVVNMIYWFTTTDSRMILISWIYTAIVSSIVSRLVLNLKAAHQRRLRDQTVTEDVSAALTNMFGQDKTELPLHGSRLGEDIPLEYTMPTLKNPKDREDY